METLSFQEKLLRVQSELKAPKGQFNSFGKYKYRNLEDILESAKPLLAKYGLCLTITDEVQELGGVLFANARAIIFDVDGTKAECRAQAGIDVDKKGMDMSQTFGSASSYARKYALNGLFLIDDTKDADTQDNSDRKVTIPASGPKFDQLVEWLRKGNDIAQAEKKYDISASVKKKLLSSVNA
jgi:hypothetical protein